MSNKEERIKRLKRKQRTFMLGLATVGLVTLGGVMLGVYAFHVFGKEQQNSQVSAMETTREDEEIRMKQLRREAGIQDSVTVEAGGELPEAKRFLIEEKSISYITALSEEELKKPGNHRVDLLVDGKNYFSYIHIIDTVSPTAIGKELVEFWDDDEIKPEDFVESMNDVTELTASFVHPIDQTKIDEEQEVEILIEDEGGNQISVMSAIKLKHDKEAPVITGAQNLTAYMGDTIAYRKGIEVTDNRDERVNLEVDSSEVNPYEEGRYNVTYTATDRAGNTTEKKVHITIMEPVNVTEEIVNVWADKILAEIITDGMSNREKAYAVYNWTRKSIAYTGHTDPSDIWKGAYQGLRYRAGDCFTYCATAHALYKRLGFQVMKIDRTEGPLKHYWNYVNYGDGWYHCDSSLHEKDFEPFMMTTKEIQAFTKLVMDRPDYYVYDEAAYPPCGNGEEDLIDYEAIYAHRRRPSTPTPAAEPTASENESTSPENGETVATEDTEPTAENPEAADETSTQDVIPQETTSVSESPTEGDTQNTETTESNSTQSQENQGILEISETGPGMEDAETTPTPIQESITEKTTYSEEIPPPPQ